MHEDAKDRVTEAIDMHSIENTRGAKKGHLFYVHYQLTNVMTSGYAVQTSSYVYLLSNVF